MRARRTTTRSRRSRARPRPRAASPRRTCRRGTGWPAQRISRRWIMRPPPRGSRPGPSAVLPCALVVGARRGSRSCPRCLFSRISWCASATPSKPSVRHSTGPDLPRLDQLVRLVALVGVGEVRADDLLLAHPQVAHVEVEVEARGAGADHDLAERLDDEHRGGEGGLADVLEHDVGRVAEDLLDALENSRETLKRAFSSSGVSSPVRIIPLNSLRSM